MSHRCSFGEITVVKIIAVSRANYLNLLSTYAAMLCGLPRLLTLNRSVTLLWLNTRSTSKCGNGVDNRQTLPTTAPLHNTHMAGACLYGVSPIPVRTGPQRSPILGVPLYVWDGYTLCRRTTKFDAVTHMVRGLNCFSSHIPNGRSCSASQFWGFSIYDYSLKKNDQTGRGNIWRRGLFLGGQPRPLSLGGEDLVDANFQGSSPLMRT